MNNIPSNSGTYALLLQVSRHGLVRHVGALGRIEFDAGYYVYVGSALNGLGARLERHYRRSGKRNHWHIDYFRSGAAVLAAVVWTGKQRIECELSRAINRLAIDKIADFGASDCSCASHLYHFQNNPLSALRTIKLQEEYPTVLRR